jgi:hypothetical protein
MRKDIGKVINEQGKLSPRTKTVKTRFKISGKKIDTSEDNEFDDLTTRLGGRRRLYGCNAKYHDSNYRPLIGWLKKQLDRPWDDVYSELRERFDVRTRTGANAIKHVKENLVEMNAFFEEGSKVPVYLSAYSRPTVDGFYVHPKTKQLKYNNPRNRKQEQKKRWMNREHTIWPSRGEHCFFELLDGFWYEVRHAPYLLMYPWTMPKDRNRECAGLPSFPSILDGNLDKQQLSREMTSSLTKFIENWKKNQIR